MEAERHLFFLGPQLIILLKQAGGIGSEQSSLPEDDLAMP